MIKLGESFAEVLFNAKSPKGLHDLFNNAGIDEFSDLAPQIGGYIFLCESEEDFKLINSPYDKPISEVACILDVYEELEGGKHYIIGLMESNAGGNLYVIPRDIFEKSQTLILSFKISKE